MDVAKTASAKASTDDLVRAALLRAALLRAADGEAVKLTGKTDGLFPSATGANKAAIERCRDAERPLLAVVGKEGKAELVALTPAGFELIAGDLTEDKVGAVAKRVAAALPAAERVGFIRAALARAPLAAAELTPLLETAVAAEKADHEARVAAAAKRRAAEEAAKAALARALELFEQRQRNRLDALRREWEAEGGRAGELPAHAPAPAPVPAPAAKPDRVAPAGSADKGFRREVAERLVSSWLYNARHNKGEAATALERVLKAIDGVTAIGAAGQGVAFDGRVHECERAVSDGAPVRVVRPGWALADEPGEPLARALVE